MRKIFVLSLAFATVLLLQERGFSQTKQDPKAFYKGAQVKFIVPYAPGGTYDLVARMLVPAFEKCSGAKMIVENMAGASGLLGGGYLYSLAKPDGLTIGIMPMPGMILAEMLEFEGAKFDMTKFTYVGRIEVMLRSMYASNASGFKSVADMQKSTKPIRFATVDPTSQSTVNEALFAEAFGLKAKIIPGYKGNKEMIMATIAGRESDAVETGFAGPFQDNVRNGEIKLIAVLGDKRHPDFPDAPCYGEIPNVTPEGKKWLDLLNILNEGGRMILAPPGMPEDRRLFLDQALAEALKDPELLKWAKENDFLVSPLSGKGCKALLDKLTTIVPKSERPKVKHIINEKYF